MRPGHAAVSRLSPAIRHRLVTEDELAAAVLEKHSLAKVEKFVQEVYWRRYWKSWLSLRPGVWADYRSSLASVRQNGGDGAIDGIESGKSGNTVINHFAQELIETGYLHNHARMWFAAWWIHEARIPWELGAAFFHKHLLDGDPASNTLSWRWVAGLQTPGKTYLARRSNLEKYLAPELAEALKDGLADFENPRALISAERVRPPITRHDLPSSQLDPDLPAGLWIHDEDLSPESSLLGDLAFQSILVAGHREAWEELGFPASKREWLEAGLRDSASRAEAHWDTKCHVEGGADLERSLVTWAHGLGLKQIVTLRPEVGLLEDAMVGLAAALNREGVHLALVDRPRDILLRPLAVGGFFNFWEAMKKRGLLPGDPG